jgi:hypothetical protein
MMGIAHHRLTIMEKFPETLPIPDSVKESQFYIFEADDIQSYDDLQELIILLYQYPERDFYLYLEQVKGANSIPLKNLEDNGILTNETEFYFYRHPKFKRDFVKIPYNSANFEWEKEVIKKWPMFMRIKLRLSEWKRCELKIIQEINIKKEIDSNPIELKPNFFGIGLDLTKGWYWLKKIFRKA